MEKKLPTSLKNDQELLIKLLSINIPDTEKTRVTNMKSAAREANKGPIPADLLVCFPSRSHLSLMAPKPICSPARKSEPIKKHHLLLRHRQLRKSGRTRSDGDQKLVSPVLWSKNKQNGSDISEPTSPKVTCAGQIKVRHKSGSCKSWQSVMEEIERIHTDRKIRKKKSNWGDSFGFKKDIMQFLTCLRSIRFDLRCFGNFPQTDITTDDEEEDEEDEEKTESQEKDKHGINNDGDDDDDNDEYSRTVFSKWFTVLEENPDNGFQKHRKSFDESVNLPPPPNALFLMRCRSAPAKSWLEEDQEYMKGSQNEHYGKKEDKTRINLRSLIDEENRENFIVMKHDTDHYKLSADIAKETWVVDGMRDIFTRSQSMKR